MKPVVYVLFLLSCLTAGAAGENSKSVQGRAADINYPRFTLINYKVQPGTDTVYQIDWNGEKVTTPLRPELLMDGAEVEAKGTLDTATNTLRAQTITFTSKLGYVAIFGGTTLIQRTPQLVKGADGWSGKIHADARDLLIDSKTELKFLPESKVQSPEQVGTNVFMAYVGKLMFDGTVHVERAAFWNNDVDSDELKFRLRDEPAIGTNEKGISVLTVHGMKPMPLVSSEQMQRYVREIGLRLVPEFQRAMPATNPSHVNWRFYVVHDKRKVVLGAMNGTVLVSDTVLKSMQNEAQLASVLSATIAQIIEEQEYQAQGRKHVQQITGWLLTGAAAVPSPMALVAWPVQMVNGAAYKRYLEQQAEQAGRVGMEYLIEAGYDPREAPKAWKQTLEKRPEDSDKMPELGRYLQTELETTYWKSDFSKFKIGTEEYKEVIRDLN
jgi:hypothetical protein